VPARMHVHAHRGVQVSAPSQTFYLDLPHIFAVAATPA